jgi:hypothetical protein
MTLSIFIPANECAPSVCLDCNSKLGKPLYGPQDLGVGSVWHIPCSCGCVYMWSWDETGYNGGVWKRRHLAPIFDDRKRLDPTQEQIKAHDRRVIFNRKVQEAAQERLRERIRTGRR